VEWSARCVGIERDQRDAVVALSFLNTPDIKKVKSEFL